MRRALPLLLLALIACDDAKKRTIDPDAITETGFLQFCAADAECGDALSCVCGVCTRTCDDDANCGDGACVPADDALSCAPAPFCAAACADDAECGDARLACVQGACVAGPAPDGGPPRPDAGPPPLDASPDAATDATPDADVPDATPDADVPDADVPDVAPGDAAADAAPPIGCDDPAQRRFADLADAVAATYRAVIGNAFLVAPDAALEIADLADRLAAEARADCRAIDIVAVGLDQLVAAQRRLADLQQVNGRTGFPCEMDTAVARIEQAPTQAAALEAQWAMLADLAANFDALPEGNVAVAFAAGDAAPLAPGEDAEINATLGLFVSSDEDEPFEVVLTLGCPDWIVLEGAAEVAGRINTEASVALRVRPGDSPTCEATLTAHARRNRTIRGLARWTLRLGEGLDAPPRLQSAIWGTPGIQRVALDSGLVGVSAYLRNDDDMVHDYTVTGEVLPDAVDATGWAPPAGTPQSRTFQAAPNAFAPHQVTFRGPNRAGDGRVRITLTAIDGEPLARPEVVHVPFRVVSGQPRCGLCEPAACNDVNPCTDDACDAFGDCVNHHQRTVCGADVVTCEDRDSLRLAELMEAAQRTWRLRLDDDTVFAEPPPDAVAAAVDAALRHAALVASDAARHARGPCVDADDTRAHLARLLDAVRALMQAADAGDGALWAPASCDTATALAPLAAALEADDTEAAFRAAWRLVARTSLPIDAVPEGSVWVRFEGLTAHGALAPGAPVDIEFTVHNKFSTTRDPINTNTFDVETRLDCPSWNLDAATRAVTIDGDDAGAVTVRVTPAVQDRLCTLEVLTTNRSNVGAGADRHTLPLALGRRPDAVAVTGVRAPALRRPPYVVVPSADPTAFVPTVLLNNYTDQPRTYRFEPSVLQDPEAAFFFQADPVYEVPPFADYAERSPEGWPVDLPIGYSGAVLRPGDQPILRLELNGIDDVDLFGDDVQVFDIPLIVENSPEPPACAE